MVNWVADALAVEQGSNRGNVRRRHVGCGIFGT
jgi:hypothetical protein